MARKSATRTIMPTKKGQHKITFKEGGLTATAHRQGKTPAEVCAGKTTGKTAKQCGLWRNVLTGPRVTHAHASRMTK